VLARHLAGQGWGLFFAHRSAVRWRKPAVGLREPTEVKAIGEMLFGPALGLPARKSPGTRPPLCAVRASRKHAQSLPRGRSQNMPSMGAQFNPGARSVAMGLTRNALAGNGRALGFGVLPMVAAPWRRRIRRGERERA